MGLSEVIDSVAAETGFAGVVRVDRDGAVDFTRAYGLACRAHEIPNTVGTRFAIASGMKGLTALTIVSLIADGALSLATSARSVLGADLPLIGGDVTIEHLLAHRSGIGDYLDEDAGHQITEYTLTVPAQDLATTQDYLAVLDGHAAKFAPGERFSYCNSGYVVLALIAERVGGVTFPELLGDRVTIPAGLADTEFLRSDELPARTATGYLTSGGVPRTNVFHLPVRGSGDGGIYSTAADISALWQAMFSGQIVSAAWVAEMLRPRSDVPGGSTRYGLGFWLLPPADAVMLTGYDPGISFRTVHDPGHGITYTVISNSSDGAWPIARRLGQYLGT